jgi:DNA-directed RNA polymerase sigma subunit (sigma70/sigma32)
VTRAIADHSRTVRVPVHVHDTLGRIRKAKSKLLAEGSKASVQDLSEATSLSNTKVKNALKVTKKLVSLDMEIGRNTLQSGDGETLHGVSVLMQSFYVFNAIASGRCWKIPSFVSKSSVHLR